METMVRPAKRVESVEEYYFSVKLKEIAQMNANGDDVINLGTVPVDGSKKADDTYMEAVEPFNYEDAIEFSGAYL